MSAFPRGSTRASEPRHGGKSRKNGRSAKGTWVAIHRLVRPFRSVVLPSLLCLTSATALGAQQRAPDASLRDLPLVEVPARGASAGTLAIFLSGDGGWAEIDKVMSDALAARGIAVVGVNARTYLTQRTTPEQADVARIARAYQARWQAPRLVLVGYSRGATMVPFVATRLAPDVRARVALLAMVGLESSANFQFHWIDVVSTVKRDDDLPVLPELARLRGTRMLCIYGTKEDDSACRAADPALITRVQHTGDHHFDKDYAGLGATIANAALGR